MAKQNRNRLVVNVRDLCAALAKDPLLVKAKIGEKAAREVIGALGRYLRPRENAERHVIVLSIAARAGLNKAPRARRAAPAKKKK